MELIFLGTSCMVPTADRNHQAIFLQYKEEGILIDCGEGTQRQFRLVDIKPTKISKILITHWHGDHVLGLPGLLQTLNASEYDKELEIYGPEGIGSKLKKMQEAFDMRFPLKVVEIKNNAKFQFSHFSIHALELKHSINCLGYAIIEKDRRRIKINAVKKLGVPEGPLLGKLQNNQKIKWNNMTIDPKDTTYVVKGKKIVIILDTLLCKNAYLLSKGADILIAEAVYTSDRSDKAEEYMHLTSSQAAQLASQSEVKKLIITHFSQRYKTTELLLQEARDVFPDAVAAYDLMRLKIL